MRLLLARNERFDLPPGRFAPEEQLAIRRHVVQHDVRQAAQEKALMTGKVQGAQGHVLAPGRREPYLVVRRPGDAAHSLIVFRQDLPVALQIHDGHRAAVVRVHRMISERDVIAARREPNVTDVA